LKEVFVFFPSHKFDSPEMALAAWKRTPEFRTCPKDKAFQSSINVLYEAGTRSIGTFFSAPDNGILYYHT
jgi:hypothetical protein